MLTKLLHYEFRTTGRIVLPIAAGVLVLNVLTAILGYFIQNTGDSMPLVGIAMILLHVAAFLSLLVVLAVCFFIEVQQFYRLLGDRGYLMLALPVQPWKHIAAKIICGTVWTLFGMLYLVLCTSLSTLSFDALEFSPMNPEDFAFITLMFLLVLACIVGALLHTYLACAFAAQFTQQRLLISICSYFVLGFIGQMLALVCVVLAITAGAPFLQNAESIATQIIADGSLPHMVIAAVLFAAVLVDGILWALTQYFMTHRLNLA